MTLICRSCKRAKREWRENFGRASSSRRKSSRYWWVF